MTTYQDLQQELREFLPHLYDLHQPYPSVLAQVLGVPAEAGLNAVQMAIVRVIGEAAPPPHVPAHARVRRLHQILVLRYIEGRTQDDVAQQLGITVRHLAREQAAAQDMLASHMREASAIPLPLATPEWASPDSDHRVPDQAASEDAAWHAQLESELASLQASSPGAVADVAKTLQEVAHLLDVLTSRRGIALSTDAVPRGCLVAVHPSVLGQVVMTAITYLARAMERGSITLQANTTDHGTEITVSGRGSEVGAPPANWQGRELISSQGGQVRFRSLEGTASLIIALPSARTRSVLVVDDNEDLVHFYRLCLAGTAYDLVHLPEGRRIHEAIASARPAVIVLDLMLPDVDGWELLAQLHEHPLSRDIPIVVCSVVREEELAFALGATVYVPKPVRRRQFVEALDRAINLAQAGSPEAAQCTA